MQNNNPPLLRVENLQMRFGGIIAVKNLSFKVFPDTITAIIGPNGAGKTTLFNCICGFYKATKGNLYFNSPHNGETDISMLLGPSFTLTDSIKPRVFSKKLYYKMFGGTHKLVHTGIARTFQNIRLFREMTVIENLLVAQHRKLNRNLIAGIIKTPHYKQKNIAALITAKKWLQYFNLLEKSNRLACELPYGEQRRLEIARAMCTNPTMICLDEPAAGLNPKETAELSELLVDLRDHHKVTILIIEHDMSLVMSISDSIIVIDHGEIIASGNPQTIQNHPAVIAAYLGEEDHMEKL